MNYFENREVKQTVYCVIFGEGIISEVFTIGAYKLLVKFTNGYEIPYTQNGVPSWGKFKKQTLFYKNGIDLFDYNFGATTKKLPIEKIEKYKEMKKLEVMMPSGVWLPYTKSIKNYAQEMIEKENLYLFRKKS